MAKISEYYNIGNRNDLSQERLLEIIEDMYQILATAVNKKPDFFERSTDGQTADTELANGSLNLNSSTKKIEMLVDHPTSSTVTWKEI
jgi:hypothetical protein